ncbi:GlxA family transcriptional regulator [Nocardiopsis sp. MG754419]|uniref:GlxA family transcriptional regulator n=1 Tax=Nocardiopsis sp. MG754419 TaxID=2259865 RepID=UPI001BA8355D|nr:DJ-1/PfpI family protein [Nocardiopsis sp. MG754419]MBR8742514.1 GlxA family transcriptional regulator [Nocardiopsis sp. MG754419]
MAERRIVVVAYDDAELLEVASITSTLATANDLLPEGAPYATVVATLGGNPARCSSGLVLHAQAALETLRGPLDTLIVSGGHGHERAAADPHLVAHVRRLSRESRRVASVCTGSSVLAAAGLLDGRRATTHWHFARDLAARHPGVTVDPAPLFIRDGEVSTAAGVTSALDLTLDFVVEDHGTPLARLVSRVLVTHLQRPGDQAQMSVLTTLDPENLLARRVLDHVRSHLDGDLGADALARAVGVSVRQLHRLCRLHTGLPPGRLVRRARTEAAADLLESTTLALSEVADRCGLGSTETLRQVFLERYGTPPSRYRAAHRERAGARPS